MLTHNSFYSIKDTQVDKIAAEFGYKIYEYLQLEIPISNNWLNNTNNLLFGQADNDFILITNEDSDMWILIKTKHLKKTYSGCNIRIFIC